MSLEDCQQHDEDPPQTLWKHNRQVETPFSNTEGKEQLILTLFAPLAVGSKCDKIERSNEI